MASAAKVASLYRSLLVLGKLYDTNPPLKALIAATDLMSPGGVPASFIQANKDKVATSSPIGRVVRLLRQSFLNDTPFYDPIDKPSVTEEIKVCVCDCVRVSVISIIS